MLPTVVSPVCLAGSLTPNSSFFPAYYSSNKITLKKFFGQCNAKDHIMIFWPELNRLNAFVKIATGGRH